MEALVCTDGKITPTEIIDVVNEVVVLHTDTNEPSGFIREKPLSMGIMEFSPDGVEVHQIDEDSDYTYITAPATFSDGSALAARKFVLYPVGANDLEVYIEGTKTIFTTTQTITFSDVSGLHYVYFTDAGVLATTQTKSSTFFEEAPIVSVMYWNATTSTMVELADERHGISMDGVTHRYLHETDGTKYVSGMGLNSLSSGGTTHGQIDSGVMYDEDINVTLAAQTTAPFWHIIGTTWETTTDSNLLGFIDSGDTRVCYNQDVTGTYQLTELAQANDCVIVFILATHNVAFPYVKIIGQNSYATSGAARLAISDELSTLLLEGLPIPEFSFVGSIIVAGSGELQLLTDGSTFLDLREVPISGSGGASGVITDHLNLLNIGTNTHAQIDTFITNGVRYDVAGSFTTAQRATAVTEDASIAFNSGNNIKFSMTGDAAITVVSQTIDQSGVIVITGADHITGYPTEFDFGIQGTPAAFAVDDVATFAYYISGASGAGSIKIGVL